MSCQSQPSAAAEAGQKNGISRLSIKKAYVIGLGLAIGGTAATAGTYFLLSRANAGKTAWRVVEGLADKKSGGATTLLPATTITTTPVSIPNSGMVGVRKFPLSNKMGNSRLAEVVERAFQTDRVTNLLSAGDKGSATVPVSQSTIRALSPGDDEKKSSPLLPDKPTPASIEQEPVELTMPAHGRLPGAKRIRSPLRMAVGVNRQRGTIYNRINNGFVLFQRNRRGEYEETGLAISPALAVTGLSKDKGIQYKEDTSRWGILHTPSGRMVSGRVEDEQLVDGWPFKNPDEATMVGRMLASTDDWTRDLEDLTRSQVRCKDDLIEQYMGRAQQSHHEDDIDEGA